MDTNGREWTELPSGANLTRAVFRSSIFNLPSSIFARCSPAPLSAFAKPRFGLSEFLLSPHAPGFSALHVLRTSIFDLRPFLLSAFRVSALPPLANLVVKNAWKTDASVLMSLGRGTHESFYVHRPLLRLWWVQPRHGARPVSIPLARTHSFRSFGNAFRRCPTAVNKPLLRWPKVCGQSRMIILMAEKRWARAVLTLTKSNLACSNIASACSMMTARFIMRDYPTMATRKALLPHWMILAKATLVALKANTSTDNPGIRFE